MEVSGRRKLKVSGKSAIKFVFRCHPCELEGKHKEAIGFCKTCMEYLCEDCYKCHCKPTVCKHHFLLDKDNMPVFTTLVSDKHKCTEVCQRHESQLLQFFCSEHDDVGCTICMILNHNSCDIDFIPDIAAEFKESEVYKALVNRVKRLKNDAKSTKKKVEEDNKEVEILYAKAIDDIRSFREEIIEYLDNIVKKLLEKCEIQKQRNDKIVRTNKKVLRDKKQELEDMYSEISKQTRDLGDLFVHAKQNSRLLGDIEQKLTEIAKIDLQMFIFEENKRILYSLEKLSSFGELTAVSSQTKQEIRQVTFPEHVVPQCIENISVKSINDNMFGRITGLVVIAPDTLVYCDFNNYSLKLKNVKTDKVTSELKISAQPCDVTCLSCHRLAVTSGDSKKIYIVSFSGGCLSKQKSFSVNGECAGITAYKEKLVVSFIDPPKVEILDTNGKVLKRIEKDGRGKALLHCPRYVATGDECFYVSDTLKHTVVKISESGQVLSEYKDENLVNPKGIEVCEDGSVLLCNYGNDNLHLITPDCEKIRIMLEGIRKPRVVCVKTSKEKTVFYVNREEEKGEFILKYKCF